MDNTAQLDFHAKYITPSEICERFGATPMNLRTLRNSGKLPNPIQVANLYIWERASAEPILVKWAEQLQARKAFYKK